MMVEGVVAELAQRDQSPSLMKGRMMRLGGALDPALMRLLAGIPSTVLTFQRPSPDRERTPKETPLETSGFDPPGGVESRISCRSAVKPSRTSPRWPARWRSTAR